MNGFLNDYSECLSADGLVGSFNLRNVQRFTRRTLSRCWLDRELIERKRFFCLNSGGCGSSYIVQLLTDNGIAKCFHEPHPDLNQLGVDHFEKSLSGARLLRLLRYTRHNVFFEANNRLFSLARELMSAFPNAQFVHLHRHPAEAVRSAMSKPDVETYLNENLRFQASLAGPKSARPLERFCHYWNNINWRIANDLSGVEFLSLKFSDLVSGNVGVLEEFIDQPLAIRKREVVNRGRVRTQGRFPDFENWEPRDRRALETICGQLMNSLGYHNRRDGAC